MGQTFLIATIIASIGLGGCDRGPGNKAAPLATDSAGVQIVSNQAPRWTEENGWRVSSAPVIRITDVAGPPPIVFGQVTAVGWLPDGRIFVGDQQHYTVRVFSAEGVYQRSMGREGSGPGDLSWFENMGAYRGDSIWIYDYNRRVVNVFSPALEFGRQFSNPVASGNYWVVAALADGRFLLYSPGGSRQKSDPGLVADSSLLILSTPDGTSTDTVGAFVYTTKEVGPDGQESTYLRPYGIAIAAGSEVIWTEAATFEYRVAAADGRLRKIVRRRYEPIPTTAKMIADFKATYLASAGGHGEPGGLKRRLDDAKYPSHLPATAAEIKSDPLRCVWVGRYNFLNKPVQWDVFDSAGVWLATVETPAGLEVHQIGVDAIIGIAKDSLDVPSVQVHHLTRQTLR